MGSMFVYFLSPLYQLSEQHPLLLALVHLYLVLVGLLLWVLIVGQDGLPRRLSFGPRFVLVLLLIPFNLALGLAVASVTQPLYPAGNTLADTQQGGNVLLGLAEVLIVAALALLFVEWAREEERSAKRNDRQLDAALAAARATIGAERGAPARERRYVVRRIASSEPLGQAPLSGEELRLGRRSEFEGRQFGDPALSTA